MNDWQIRYPLFLNLPLPSVFTVFLPRGGSIPVDKKRIDPHLGHG
jgi:hypothetical protein